MFSNGLTSISVGIAAGTPRKPNSVPARGLPRRRATIIPLGYRLPGTSSDLPGSFRRAALKRSPIRSCTGWGLPSFPGRPGNWCALTAPFHPYRGNRTRNGRRLPRRYLFCGTFLHVAVTPGYGAPRPVVFGLSSGAFCCASDRLGSADRKSYIISTHIAWDYNPSALFFSI